MERVEQTESTIEVFENDIDLYLHQFQDEQGIEDLRTVPQSVWNACLMYIQRHVFNNKDLLKQRNNIYNNNSIMDSNYNMYNYDLLYNILEYYIYMCNLYCKEISNMGFSKLTGIDNDTISLWGRNENKLSSKSLGIYKKIKQENEECWVNNLYDGKKNPVSSYGALKQRHHWESPYAFDINQQKRVGTDAELPKLAQNSPDVVQIAQTKNSE